MSKAVESLPDIVEEVLDDVVKQAVSDMDWLIDTLMPDGRPFGMEIQSEDDQLQGYLAEGYHDNIDACSNWIRMRVVALNQMLMEFGVAPELVASIHPYDIVEAAALVWSSKMEALYKKKAQEVARIAQSLTSAPPVPQMPSGEMTVGATAGRPELPAPSYS